MDIPIDQLINYAKLSFNSAFLKGFKEALVIEKYAIEHKMILTPDELQESSDTFFTQQGIHGETAARQWLKKNGFRYEDYEQMLILKLFREKVTDQVVTEDQIKAYFNDHLYTFEQVRLYKILIEDESQMLAVAQKIKNQVIDFYQAARRYSEDKKTAYAFGFAGALRYADMPYEYHQAILNTKDTMLIGPLQTEEGYVLLRADELLPPILNAVVYQEIKELLFGTWLKNEVKKMKDIKLSGSLTV